MLCGIVFCSSYQRFWGQMTWVLCDRTYLRFCKGKAPLPSSHLAAVATRTASIWHVTPMVQTCFTQVRQQLRHLPYPRRRLFRQYYGRTELRIGLLGLRAIVIPRHVLYFEVYPEQRGFPSMCRRFVDWGLLCGTSVEPAVWPRAASASARVVTCALRAFHLRVFFCVIVCVSFHFILFTYQACTGIYFVS